MKVLKRMTMAALGTLLLTSPALAIAGGEGGYGGAGKEQAAQKKEKNIIDTAKAAGNFKTLLKALDEAGLTETLKQEGPFTVFAPTDEAFAKIPKADLDALLQDKERLREVLLSHVLPGQRVTEMQVRQLEEGAEVRTAADTELKVSKEGEKLSIQGANVVRAGVQASNGLIHVIDTVILDAK